MRILYRFFRKCILAAALLVIFVTLFLNTSYFIINHYFQNNTIFSRIASAALKQSVQIKNVRIDGMSFLPIFVFHDIQLSTAIGSTTRFREIAVRVNLWDSLLEKRVVTSEIMIDGLQWRFDEKKNVSSQTFSAVLDWIASQPKVELQNTMLTICRANAKCITVNPIQIVIKNYNINHKIVADFNWLSSPIRIVATVTGNPLEDPYAIASIYADGNNVSVMKGGVNFKFWANYKNKQWQDAKAVFAVRNMLASGIKISKADVEANWTNQTKKIILSANANLFGETINHIHASVVNFAKPILSGGVQIQLPFAKAFSMLQKMPDFRASHFSDVRGDGLVKCDVQFKMPLDQLNDKTPQFQMNNKIIFLNNKINFPKWDLTLSAVSGVAEFVNNQFVSKNISAMLFQKPILFSVIAGQDEKIKVDLQKFNFLNQDWSGLQIKLSPKKSDYFIQLHNKNVFADITVPDNNKIPVKAEVHYLYWKMNPNNTAQTSFPAINPATLLPFDLSIQNLYVNQESDGELIIAARMMPNGLKFEKIKLHSPLLVFSARGSWIKRGMQQETTLLGNMQSDNFGLVLLQHHLSSRLKGGVFATEFALTWPNSPQQFSMSTARGQMRVDLQQGRIVQLDSDTEMNLTLGRLFNLLSMESISRFLTFDFSSMTKKGFAFDALRGKFDVRDGALWTRGIDIDGSLAKINLVGKISLQNETNDLLMRVVPQVSSSLPTIAGLAGGPVVGAVTWVANKLVSPTVGEMMQKEYRISGTWEKPTVRQVS